MKPNYYPIKYLNCRMLSISYFFDSDIYKYLVKYININ